MARPVSSYDPEQFGRVSKRIPEGVHKFKIDSAEVDGDRWVLLLQPVEEEYLSDWGYKVWLNEDGCVNMIYDAAGANPMAVEDREYTPYEFCGKVIQARIVHVESKKNGKTYANIESGRLYPAFSLGQTPTQPQPVQQVQAEPVQDYANDIPF